jgi:hypothetical protein
MNSLTAAIQDMGIDHRGTDISVPQELLNGPDVVSIFQQMCGEEVPKCMAGGGPRNTCFYKNRVSAFTSHKPVHRAEHDPVKLFAPPCA